MSRNTARLSTPGENRAREIIDLTVDGTRYNPVVLKDEDEELQEALDNVLNEYGLTRWHTFLTLLDQYENSRPVVNVSELQYK